MAEVIVKFDDDNPFGVQFGSISGEIVRCKNCIHRKRIPAPKGLSNRYCVILDRTVDLKDYCSWGEKK